MSFFGSTDDNNSRFEAKTSILGARSEKEEKLRENPWFRLPLKVRIIICCFSGFCFLVLSAGAYQELSSVVSSKSRESDFGNFSESPHAITYEMGNRHYVSQNDGIFSSLFCNGIRKPSFCEE